MTDSLSTHHLVIQHLKQHHMYQQAISVEQHLNLQLDSSKELQFLRNILVYQAEYQVTLQFIHFYHNPLLDDISFQIKKLWILDLLLNHTSEAKNLLIMKLLQEIRNEHNQEEEFKQICFLMTLQDLSQSEQFKDWSIHKGRYLLFETIKLIINQTEQTPQVNSLTNILDDYVNLIQSNTNISIQYLPYDLNISQRFQNKQKGFVNKIQQIKNVSHVQQKKPNQQQQQFNKSLIKDTKYTQNNQVNHSFFNESNEQQLKIEDNLSMQISQTSFYQNNKLANQSNVQNKDSNQQQNQINGQEEEQDYDVFELFKSQVQQLKSKDLVNQIEDMSSEMNEMFQSNANFYKPKPNKQVNDQQSLENSQKYNLSQLFHLDQKQETMLNQSLSAPKVDLQQTLSILFPDINLNLLQNEYNNKSLSLSQLPQSKLIENEQQIQEGIDKIEIQMNQDDKNNVQIKEQEWEKKKEEDVKVEGIQEDSFEWQDLEFNVSKVREEEEEEVRYKQLSELVRIEEEGAIRCGVFSNKGKYLCLGSNSKQLRIFKLEMLNDKSEISCLPTLVSLSQYHQGSIYCIDFNSQETMLASGSNDKTVKVLTIENEQQTVLNGHKGIVRSIQWSRDNNQLYSAGSDGCIHLWDINTQTILNTITPHSTGVDCIKYQDGLLFSSAKDNRLIAYDPRTASPHMDIPMTLPVCNYFSLNNHNTNIAVAHNEGYISIWDQKTHKAIQTLQIHQDDCRTVEYNPDNQFLVTSSFDCTAKVISTHPSPYSLINSIDTHSDKVVMAKFHPTKDIILTTSVDNTASLFINSQH